ncbi:antibiotic biosynthesis monooxygenase family protein [Hydromonas duriensis]|uniref:Heme-degrading monooxygenase HmoA n=1 Tax=Hydromonas duriensis TaxID=1527608 RepID=A0A4R6Y856_9BURK|nr:antibiotic biosynthesis monooxygenase [Hydromonas duriensis]TDR31543.1 heme-degrading monooxygenase HmoA [Hydromonas duriensis]
MFAHTPPPPYYAVIFSNQLAADAQGYDAMADRMVELAQQQNGFLGAESVRDAAGFGITVSYWQSEQDIAAWKNHAEHVIAQETGRERWYEQYITRVAKVERAYGFTHSTTNV